MTCTALLIELATVLKAPTVVNALGHNRDALTYGCEHVAYRMW
jgi:hypothetical protein